MVLPHLEQRGLPLTAVSGTSGSAVLAGIMSNALNKGQGIEGVREGFAKLWHKVGAIDTAYGLSKFHAMTEAPLIGGVFKLIEDFTAMALAHTGGPTHETKRILAQIVGHAEKLAPGPVTPYVNYLLRDPLTRDDHHVIARGSEVTLDKIVGSGGLDELGNHRTVDWKTGIIQVMRDGAYFGGANPVLGPMIEEQRPTDVIVITLHGPATRVKTAREHNLKTIEIHGELDQLKDQYRGQVRFHPIHLDFGDMDHLVTDPEHLAQIATTAQQQTALQLPRLLASLDHGIHHAPRMQPNHRSRSLDPTGAAA